MTQAVRADLVELGEPLASGSLVNADLAPTTPIGLVTPGLGFRFSGAWFSAAIISFVTYYALMRPRKTQ